MISKSNGKKMRIQPRIKVKLQRAYLAVISSALVFSLVMVSIVYFGNTKNTFALAAGDYRSKVTGNWNAVGTWETYDGVSWINAVATPTNTAGVITIQNTHTVSVSANVTVDEVVVELGASLNVNNGRNLTIANGAGDDLTVNGTLTINGTLTNQANSKFELFGLSILKSGGANNFAAGSKINVNNGGRYRREDATMTTAATYWTVQSGGVYQHNLDGAAIPLATWIAGSLCEVTGVVTTKPSSLTQAFANFTYNCPNQTSVEDLMGAITTINGDFTFVSTGTGTVRLAQPQNYTLAIGGNFYMQGGTLFESTHGTTPRIDLAGDFIQTGGTFAGTDATNNSGQGKPTLNVSGNFSISAGTFNLSQYTGNTGTLGLSTLNLFGNFTQTGGTITETATQTGKGDVYFKKTGTQLFTKSGGTISNTVDFSINSGAIVDMTTNIITGGGAFALKSGGGILIGSNDGITAAGALGNIQVTGTRSYNTGADYTFNGLSPQSTGDGLPATVNKLTIDNSNDITLTNSTSVSNTLTFTSGNVLAAADTLTLGISTATLGTLVRTSGQVVGNFKRWFAASTVNNVLFPLGTGGFDESMNISFTVAPTTGGSLSATYAATDPGKNGFNLYDAPDSITNIGFGLWTSTPGNGLAGGTFNVDITATALPSVVDYTKLRLLRRANAGSAWTMAGVHSAGTGSNAVPVIHRTGMTVHGQFGIGSSSVNPLPIELIYFNAKLEEKIVKLTWATASEINNDYFTIERSSDGVTFDELLRKPGAGNSTSQLNYSGEDLIPLSGNSYYRLKQTDYDGHFSYSGIKPVYYSLKPGDGDEIQILSISPNPFAENFNLNFSAKSSSTVEIILVNSSGQTILKDKIQSVEGFNSYQFSNSYTLTKGIYFVYLLCNGQKVIQKVINE